MKHRTRQFIEEVLIWYQQFQIEFHHIHDREHEYREAGMDLEQQLRVHIPVHI